MIFNYTCLLSLKNFKKITNNQFDELPCATQCMPLFTLRNTQKETLNAEEYRRKKQKKMKFGVIIKKTHFKGVLSRKH